MDEAMRDAIDKIEMSARTERSDDSELHCVVGPSARRDGPMLFRPRETATANETILALCAMVRWLDRENEERRLEIEALRKEMRAAHNSSRPVDQ